MLRRKCPTLTFDKANLDPPKSLNFLEIWQVKAAIPRAVNTLRKQRDFVAFKGKQTLHKDLNCVKWSKPVYERDGTHRKLGEGRQKDHVSWLEFKNAGTSLTSLCSLKSIYRLHVDQIITPIVPFRCKIDLEYGPQDWASINKQKISTYSRQQAFHWRSTLANCMVINNFVVWRSSQFQTVATVMKSLNQWVTFILTVLTPNSF